MSMWLQHLVALCIVAACATFVLWQVVQTLRMRGRTLGCCRRGCGAGKTPRIVFLPANMLGRRKNH